MSVCDAVMVCVYVCDALCVKHGMCAMHRYVCDELKEDLRCTGMCVMSYKRT